MKVYKGTDQLPDFHNAVLTIGTFDGVHEGHKTILNSVVQYARSIGGESVLITFDPHPRKLIFPDQPLKLLHTLDEKLELIRASGIDAVVVVPFTRSFSQMSAREYIEHFLVGRFHPAAIIIGYDHHFGNDRSGDISMLRDVAAQYDFEVTEIPVQLVDAAAVSSTQIRHALNQGRMGDAAHMLGQYYSLGGHVVRGAQLGRTIGYPTANILPDNQDKLVPPIGVYAVLAQPEGDKAYPAMMSIGYNPTVTDDRSVKLEVHLFDFNEDLYGRRLDIRFVQRLRDEEHFPSLEALTDQIRQDEVDSRVILADIFPA